MGVLRGTYADGHREGWALLTTEDFVGAQQPPRDYRRRRAIMQTASLLPPLLVTQACWIAQTLHQLDAAHRPS